MCNMSKRDFVVRGYSVEPSRAVFLALASTQNVFFLFAHVSLFFCLTSLRRLVAVRWTRYVSFVYFSVMTVFTLYFSSVTRFWGKSSSFESEEFFGHEVQHYLCWFRTKSGGSVSPRLRLCQGWSCERTV